MKTALRTVIILTAIASITALALQFNKDARGDFEKGLLQKSQDFKPSFERINSDIKSPDQPDMAAFQEYLITFDPATDQIPKGRLFESYQTTRRLQQEQADNGKDALLQWETSGSNMGGRTRALMFDPMNNGKLWAGGITGGLWSLENVLDLDVEWTPVGDFWSNLAVSCITYDPNNTDIMYVGTGEAQTARTIYRASSGVGAGIFKTTDAGETWNLMESSSEFDFITDIAVRDESGTSVIYACVASGTYEGTNHQSSPTDGLYRSEDEGETWTQVLPTIFDSPTNPPYTPADIEIATDGRIYIGTMENLEHQGGATILYSDDGEIDSWNVFSDYNDLISNESYYNIPARTLVASSPTDPNVVYAQFAAGYNDGFDYYRGRYMAKSTDNGESWNAIQIPDAEWSTLAWHAFDLKVDPEDPNTLYTGGLDLWKSMNGGNSWEHISDWSMMYYGGGDDYVHADQHNIQFLPGNSNVAVFSSDGGVFLTTSANQNSPGFIERNQGYSTLQFYSCALNPTAGSPQYIGGLQDNGTLIHTGSALTINDMIAGGDGAFCFWDQIQPNIFITSVYYNSYQIWNNGSQTNYVDGNSGTFVSPADYNSTSNTLYSNACDFFGTDADKLMRLSGVPYNGSYDMIDLGTNTTVPFTHVKNSPYTTATTTLFVGTASGQLFKVTTAEDSPVSEEIGDSNFPTASISCVAIGESEDELLVTFSNYGVSSVWLTTDGGENWIEKESNLPDMPIRWAIFHPENHNQVLLATELGVWWTNTLHLDETEWVPSIDNMANVRVDMLQIRTSDNTVLAATHGRGLFTAEYVKEIYNNTDELATMENQFKLFPNPASDQFNITSQVKTESSVLIRITNLSGQTVLEEQTAPFSTKEVSINQLNAGTYIVSLNYNNRVERHKLIVE